ncbi:hypothetical protein CRYUN_Cryun24cG0031300 [Craigia yunnanensis]
MLYFSKDSGAVKEVLDQLSEVGWANKWSSQPYVSRRMTSLRELTTLGIKNAENLAIPSVRNDLTWSVKLFFNVSIIFLKSEAFLLLNESQQGHRSLMLASKLTILVCSYRLLQAAIGGFSSFFPDYQETIARHEAAHFSNWLFVGPSYPGYSLDIGKEHVNLIDEKLEKLIYSGQLDAKELDRLAVVALAGLAAEGLKYDKVVGQSADLFTLQVLFAGSLLKNNKVTHEALISAMSKKSTVLECIEAIEKAT